MTRLGKKIEQFFVAAAFAEEGDVQTAREIMRERQIERKRETAVLRPRVKLSAPSLRSK